MIWISTFCLLFVAAWLFFNAMNERRWVQAHSHDEAVASDRGFMPSFSASTGTGSIGSDGKISIDQEDTGFARAVSKVRNTTSKYGEIFFESKVEAAKADSSVQRPAGTGEQRTAFERAVARVGESAGRVDQKLSEKIKQASSRTRTAPAKEESLLERTSRKVASKSSEVGNKVANRAKNIAQGLGDGHSATDENGMFSKMANKVSTGMGNIESSIGSKISSRRSATNQDQDLVSRVSEKISKTVNQLDKNGPGTKPKSTNQTEES